MAQPVIELKNISKSFNENHILKDVNLTIEEGDSVTIVGPGGCGKSVLLKIIAHIITPDSGVVYFHGRNTMELSKEELKDFRHRTGMLFQNYALFDSLNIRDNVGFYLDYHTKTDRTKITKKVLRNLRLVRLKGVGNLKPAELSGGMKKRVGIARAIIHNPDIIFFDEPTAGLDPVTTDSISKLINELHKELSMTLINMTNDMGCARRIGNKLAMLYDGKIHKIGLQEEMWNSDDPVVHQFLHGKREGPIQYHQKVI